LTLIRVDSWRHSPPQAPPVQDERGVLKAEFNGITIDINADDWQGATDCLYASGRWQCFSTSNEARKHASDLDAQGKDIKSSVLRSISNIWVKPAWGIAAGQCSRWALLFENVDFNQRGQQNAGRTLRYKDMGNWLDLPSSFQASAVQAPPDCNLYLAQSRGGYGHQAGIIKGNSVRDLRTQTDQLKAGEHWDDRARSICLSGDLCPPPG
jgi:hypothetical protein